VTAVDYLIYSMASAELKTLSEESHEVLNSYKATVGQGWDHPGDYKCKKIAASTCSIR
jgi:hypothetical protein